MSDPPSDINFPLYLYIIKGLLAEALFPECTGTPCNRARGGALGEDAVDTRLAHFVVAFWVDEEAHIGVEIAGRFAYGADVWRAELVGVDRGQRNIIYHLRRLDGEEPCHCEWVLATCLKELLFGCCLEKTNGRLNIGVYL